MSRLGCAIVVALALAASACASAQARSEPGGPALASPVPPPHAIVPVEIVEEPAAPPAPPTPSDVLVKGSELSREPKPGPGTEKPVEKPDPAAVQAQPASPAPPLQTTKDVEGMKTAIRKTMDQAKLDLARTASLPLNAERRAQHDTAKRFLEQAEEALKVENLVFAEQMANKAATLAAALAQK